MGLAGAWTLYLNLLRSAEGPDGKLEVGGAIVRALVSRLARGRGALHVRRPVVIAAGGLRWRVPPYDNSFASTTPGRDTSSVLPEIRRLLATRAEPVCLDIGANIGFVCMPLAREFPDRRFVAVEPIPWLAAALEDTARLNGFANVTVVARAIAAGECLDLAVPTVGDVRLTTLSSAGEPASPEAAGRTHERHEVPAITLDALIDELHIDPGAIACVKIDVEGFEAAALATGGRALSFRPPVLFEALTPALCGEVESVLRGFGYSGLRRLDAQNFAATA
jgi:FkbM family methyltransferase